MIYYLFDAQRIFTRAVECSKYDPVPPDSTRVAPPDLADGQLAQWTGRGWAVLGERPTPPEPTPDSVPDLVTRAQGKAALIQAGLWDSVVAFVDAIEDPIQQALARVALDDTLEWRRDSPFLNAAAAALGLTSEQLDDLFRQAEGIAL